MKEVRPEICNKVVENIANEIVTFKSGYLMGEPIQYVSRGDASDNTDSINTLNEYVFAEEKAAKDKTLADWFHICGTAFRMILPDSAVHQEEDESPFEIYTLDPRNTFVIYENALGNKPLLAVKYVVDRYNTIHYTCYSADRYLGNRELDSSRQWCESDRHDSDYRISAQYGKRGCVRTGSASA